MIDLVRRTAILARHLRVVALSLGMILLAPGAQQFALAQTSPDDDLRAAAAEFDRLTRALEASLADLPRDSFDPETLVLDEIGFDAADIFAWVRDNTGLVPYRGALRGPRGVLMDRTGNSLDRSLLLYDMLSAVGEEVRLAHADLSEAQAQALFDTLAQSDPAPLPSAGSGGDLERYATDAGVDPADLAAADDENDRVRVELRARLDARVAAQTAALSQFADIAGGGDAAASVAALRDHWWVQWSDGGDWTDLDTATAAPGESLATAERTEQPLGLTDLAPELLQTVTVRVVAECWDGAALTETAVLESDPLIPADLLGSDLFLRHVPVGWPETAPEDFDVVSAAPERSLDAAADIEHWVPVIRAGGGTQVGLAVSDDCTFPTAASLTWPGAAVTEAVGGATDLFNTLPTGEEEDGTEEAEESETLLTAEWIEYEIRIPGSDPHTVRRQLFDRIGAGVRLGGGAEPGDDGLDWRLALLGQTDILLQPHRLSEPFVEALLGRALLANRDALLTAAREAEIGPSDALTDALDSLSFPPSALYSLAMARQVGMAPEAFLAAPNILGFHSQLRRSGGDYATVESFDIAVNDLEVHPSALAEAGSVRLAQGVRDTNAEALMARGQCASVRLEGIGCEQRPNAADRLAADPDGWALVADADELAALDLATVPAGVDRAFAAGRVALIKLDGAPVWWQLDPTTGAALGMGENGWGDAAVDYAIALWANVLGFAFCAAGASDTVGRAACAAGVFVGWGAGIASLVGASVATKVLAVIAILLSGLPVVVAAHSGD